MDKMRICFAGTPAFAAAHLQALLDAQYNVVAVYTQPDRRSGRGKKLQASPVKLIAQENSLPLFQPASLKPAEQAQSFAELKADVLIVVAYGLILPKSILEIPKFGCINVHASLLPRWRGAAPIERALLAGDEVSGVTIMQMDEGLDTGAMLYKESIGISATDNRLDLEEKLTRAGKAALLQTLGDLQKYRDNAEVQDNTESSYAAKLEKSEALIDWHLSAEKIDRQIRAGIGRAPAYTYLGNQRLRIIEARPSSECWQILPGHVVQCGKDYFTVCCGSSSLQVLRIQMPGKTPTTVKDIANSRPDFFKVGTQFTPTESC